MTQRILGSIFLFLTSFVMVIAFQNCGGTAGGQCAPGYFCDPNAEKVESSSVGFEEDGSGQSESFGSPETNETGPLVREDLSGRGSMLPPTQNGNAQGNSSNMRGMNGSSQEAVGNSQQASEMPQQAGGGGASIPAAQQPSTPALPALKVAMQLPESRVVFAGGKLHLQFEVKHPQKVAYKWYFKKGRQAAVEVGENFRQLEANLRINNIGLAQSGKYWAVAYANDGRSLKSAVTKVDVLKTGQGCRAGEYGINGAKANADRFQVKEAGKVVGYKLMPVSQLKDIKTIHKFQFPDSTNRDLISRKNACNRRLPYINPIDTSKYEAVGGAIVFQCKNDKWIFVANNCQFNAK